MSKEVDSGDMDPDGDEGELFKSADAKGLPNEAETFLNTVSAALCASIERDPPRHSFWPHVFQSEGEREF